VLGLGAVAALLQCPSGPGGFGSCLPDMGYVAAGATKAATTPDERRSVAVALDAGGTGQGAPTAGLRQNAETAWIDALIAGSFEMLPAEPDRSRVADVPQGAAEQTLDTDESVTGSTTVRPLVTEAAQMPGQPLPAPQSAAAPDQAMTVTRMRVAVSGFAATSLVLPAAATVTVSDPVGPPEPAMRTNLTAALQPAETPADAPAPPVEGEKPTFLRAADSLNVRSGPGSSYGKLFVLPPGSEVEMVRKQGGWASIVDADGRSGWAYASFLTGDGAGPAQASLPVKKKKASVPANIRIVGGLGVNVRSGPSKSSARLFALEGGKKVTVSENRKGWLRVTDERGRTGWIYSSFLVTPGT
jgi:uncharacterized protein YgiM (DUF1202 family)